MVLTKRRLTLRRLSLVLIASIGSSVTASETPVAMPMTVSFLESHRVATSSPINVATATAMITGITLTLVFIMLKC